MMKFKVIHIISLFLIISFLFTGCTSDKYWYFSVIELTNDTCENSCIIAIIDTGINDQFLQDHSENIIYSYNILSETENVTDYHGHGTEMASIILGDKETNLIGINPKVSLIIIKAIGKSGKTDNSNIGKAINYLLQLDDLPDIISLSLGSLNDDSYLKEQIEIAIQKNIVIVASVGDYRQKDVLYPAAYDGVISVAAVDEDDNLDYMSNTSSLTTLLFPGVDINVLDFNGDEKIVRKVSGSSVATALASGYFSLFISECKNNDILISNRNFYNYLSQNTQKNKTLNYKKFNNINRYRRFCDEKK